MSLKNYTQIVADVLDPLIPDGSTVALLDFPNYSNVGDSAIWLGEYAYLARRKDLRVGYVCVGSESSANFSKISPEYVILIHGGGNFGDLWPQHQQFRERIIQQYQGSKIIQLPQSIHFQDDQHFERCRNILNLHPDFHLIVRDRESLDLAGRIHDGPNYLCPDMALCMGAAPRTAKPRHPIVCLMRTDKEKAVSGSMASCDHVSMHTTDWLDEPLSVARWTNAKLDWLQGKFPRWIESLDGMKPFLFQRLATERFKRGCDILCSGEVVITDRLHGHIMCCLLGIPHVVLDNSYRKLGNFRDAWGTGEGLCESASSFQEAQEKARALLERFRGLSS
jgi:pyruvyl transferase EpsO